MGLQLSELELSDSDRIVGSIIGACLDGSDGDSWMLDAEGAHEDIQVGDTAGVNDPSDIPWRTTAWSAGGGDVGSVKTENRTGEGRQQPTSALNGKTVTLDQQEEEIGENGNGVGAARRGSQVRGKGQLEGMSHGQQWRTKS